MNSHSLRPHGWSLIAASAGLLVTLLLRPSEQGLLDPAQTVAVGHRMVLVHSLALAILPLWLFGAIGIARRLAGRSWTGLAGMVAHGFAMMAMMNALVIDGLVTPDLAEGIVHAKPAGAVAWKVAFNHNALLDAAFMRVAIVALSAAVFIWSLGSLRSAAFGRAIAIGGLLLGSAAIICQLTGWVSSQPLIFMLILLGQLIWFVSAGVSLVKGEERVGEKLREAWKVVAPARAD